MTGRAVTFPRGGLASGQIWKLKHAYVEIVELGRRLIRFRMLDTLEEIGARVLTSDIDVLQRYLVSRRAKLITITAAQPRGA